MSSRKTRNLYSQTDDNSEPLGVGVGVERAQQERFWVAKTLCKWKAVSSCFDFVQVGRVNLFDPMPTISISLKLAQVSFLITH